MKERQRGGIATAIVIAAAMLMLFISCATKTTQPVPEENYLPNGSFETYGAPSLYSWTPANSELVDIVPQPAPRGGFFSLQLTADWAPTSGFVTTTVPDLKDGDIVRLSAYVRARGSEGGGSISVHNGNPSTPAATQSKWASTSDTIWTLLSVTDTLELGPGDSLYVMLSSLVTELRPRVGQFDRVTLVRISD